MSEPYVGEIRLFAGNFAPLDWNFCDGSILQISENSVLFNLIGTTYGGDGVTTFQLPDLRGRVPVHQGTSNLGTTYVLGEQAGVENVTLTLGQTPSHTHALAAQSGAGASVSNNPAQRVLAASSAEAFSSSAPDSQLAATAVETAGGSQPHSNLMPFQCLNYIISLYGIYPSQD